MHSHYIILAIIIIIVEEDGIWGNLAFINGPAKDVAKTD